MLDFKKISLCLITKDPVYPQEILDNISQFPWGEVLILKNSDSVSRRYELAKKAKFETIAFQDDDCICHWNDILALSQPDIINTPLKQGHFDAYKDSISSLVGWGSVFPKSLLNSLEKYVIIYGEDEVYKRECDRIFTYLNFPQNRLVLPIVDLPSAYAPDRMWRQPNHGQSRLLAEERCKNL
jgi:hypothetical protein